MAGLTYDSDGGGRGGASGTATSTAPPCLVGGAGGNEPSVAGGRSGVARTSAASEAAPRRSAWGVKEAGPLMASGEDSRATVPTTPEAALSCHRSAEGVDEAGHTATPEAAPCRSAWGMKGVGPLVASGNGNRDDSDSDGSTPDFADNSDDDWGRATVTANSEAALRCNAGGVEGVEPFMASGDDGDGGEARKLAGTRCRDAAGERPSGTRLTPRAQHAGGRRGPQRCGGADRHTGTRTPP